MKLAKNEFTEFRLEVGETVAPLAKLGVSIGGGFFGILNDLPGPLKRAAAMFSLLTPAIASFGAIMISLAAKKALIDVAMKPLLASGILETAPKLKSLALAYQDAGGSIFKMARRAGTEFAAANTNMRAEMIKTIAVAGLWGAAFIAIGIAFGSAVQAFATSGKKARATIDDIVPDDFTQRSQP
jgi:hypothetical protein